MAIDKDIGKRIRAARLHADISQPVLAKSLGIASSGTVSMMETGRRGVSSAMLGKLAKALRVSATWLLTGDDPPAWANKQEKGNTPMFNDLANNYKERLDAMSRFHQLAPLYAKAPTEIRKAVDLLLQTQQEDDDRDE